MQVVSSVVAAWSDITVTMDTLQTAWADPAFRTANIDVSAVMQNLNAGYVWMLFNCIVSAAYVSRPLLLHFDQWITPPRGVT